MYKQTILDEILDRDNLNNAYKQVSKNKGSAGVDGMTIDEAGGYLAKNKEEIVETIRERNYKPQPVLRVEITKQNGGIRFLGIHKVIEILIHHNNFQYLTLMIYSTNFVNRYILLIKC